MTHSLRRQTHSNPSVPSLLATAGLAAVLGLGLLSGCSGFSSEEKPLPDSTFATMLTELHLANARSTLLEPVSSSFRDSLFARHEVDSTTFRAALEYYSRHPKAFETLYGSVIDSLQSLQRPKKDRTTPGEGIRDSLYRQRQRPGNSP